MSCNANPYASPSLGKKKNVNEENLYHFLRWTSLFIKNSVVLKAILIITG